MTIDRYTKFVLTVIAAALLWLCAMNVAPSLTAQSAAVQKISNATVQPVIIVGTGTMDQQGTVTVNFVRQPDRAPRTDPAVPVQLPYNAAKPLPVALPYTDSNPMPSRLSYTAALPLPVEIAAVKKTGEWEPLRARVEDALPRSKPGGGE
jgi:hypothetical protein